MVHAHKERKPDRSGGKDQLYAKTGFWLSLGFWIPLFNIVLCILGMVFSLLAIRNHLREPARYGGYVYAILGLVISLSGLVLTIIGFVLWLTSGSLCSSAICTLT